MVDETVGEEFKPDLLQDARDKTLAVILRAAREIGAGTTEAQAKGIVQRIQKELGGEKAWHPPQIRFGENTLLAFGEKPAQAGTLKQDDIFFLDIGPIFSGHEGDVGRAFSVGVDPEMKRCCEDVEKIWNEVRDHWKTNQVSGQILYEFAAQSAEKRGWILSLKGAAGHRIADFPHAARHRGKIAKLSHSPAENRWILEIQIRHPKRDFGAFYEDLLN